MTFMYEQLLLIIYIILDIRTTALTKANVVVFMMDGVRNEVESQKRQKERKKEILKKVQRACLDMFGSTPSALSKELEPF
jgi:hypothetical protein